MTLSNDTSVPVRLGDGAPSPGPDRCGSAGKLVSLVVSTYTDNHLYRERGSRPVLGFDHSRRSDSPFERRLGSSMGIPMGVQEPTHTHTHCGCGYYSGYYIIYPWVHSDITH